MRQTDFFMKASDPKTLTVEQLMPDAVNRCASRTDASTSRIWCWTLRACELQSPAQNTMVF